MRIYHATFTFVSNHIDESVIKHRHVFVAEAFGARVWVAVKGVANPLLFANPGNCFAESARSHGLDTPTLNRGHTETFTETSFVSMNEAMQRIIDSNQWNITHDVASFIVEPLSPAERAWFITEGYSIHSRLLDILDAPFYGRKSHAIITRRNRVRNDARIKLGFDRPAENKARYKGCSIDAFNFKLMRGRYKALADAVRKAIKTQDAEDLEEWYECYGDERMMERSVEAFIAISARIEDAGGYTDLERTYCDHVVRSNDTVEVREGGRMRTWCEHCRDHRAVWVEDQEEYWYSDDAIWSDREDAYYSYDRDAELEENDDDDDDYDRDEEPNRLMSYMTVVTDFVSKDTSFTPSPFGDFLMGIELEMATSGSISSAVELVREALDEDYCICKSDGSLPSGGFEVVTAPRKLDEHITRFSSWFTAGIPAQFSAWDIRGHNGDGACGMHIHIDSRAFTAMTLGKFLMLINDSGNVDFIRRIAGRHPAVDKQAREYCAAESQEILGNPKQATKGKSHNRYRMVNTTCLKRSEAERLGVQYVGERSFNTIELRIFRSSLKRERMLAQIEFTHAAVMFCRVASYRDLNQVNFIKWLRTTNNTYPNLADWYGVRRRATAKNSAPAELACADRV